jgi:magnesium transporter
MEAVTMAKSWERLRELLADQQPAELVAYLKTLTSDETVRAVFRLTPEEQARLLTSLPAESAAELIDDVPEVHAAEILDDLPREDAASIVGELASDQVADVLGELDEEDLEEILEHMDPADAEEARKLISYPWDTAGGLMMTEYLSYKGATRVGEVIADLSTRTEDFPLYHLQQIYVVRPSGLLRGVVNLNDIAFADPARQLAGLVRAAEPVSADADLPAQEEFFEGHDQVVAPVVGHRNRLVGVLRCRAVYEAVTEKADDDALKRQGIVGGAPVVIKLLEGTQGVGVVLAETQKGCRERHRGVSRTQRQLSRAGIRQGSRRRGHPLLRDRGPRGCLHEAPG